MEENKCVCEMSREELSGKLSMMEAEIAELKAVIEDQKLRRKYQDGLIEGLQFALRVNGVSGGEVRC